MLKDIIRKGDVIHRFAVAMLMDNNERLAMQTLSRSVKEKCYAENEEYRDLLAHPEKYGVTLVDLA